jgi:hypothetical protein
VRKQVQHRLALDAVMAFRYEHRRRDDLLRDCEQLIHRMKRIENKLRLCDDGIAPCARTMNRQQGTGTNHVESTFGKGSASASVGQSRGAREEDDAAG